MVNKKIPIQTGFFYHHNFLVFYKTMEPRPPTSSEDEGAVGCARGHGQDAVQPHLSGIAASERPVKTGSPEEVKQSQRHWPMEGSNLPPESLHPAMSQDSSCQSEQDSVSGRHWPPIEDFWYPEGHTSTGTQSPLWLGSKPSPHSGGWGSLPVSSVCPSPSLSGETVSPETVASALPDTEPASTLSVGAGEPSSSGSLHPESPSPPKRTRTAATKAARYCRRYPMGTLPAASEAASRCGLLETVD